MELLRSTFLVSKIHIQLTVRMLLQFLYYHLDDDKTAVVTFSSQQSAKEWVV